MGRNLQPTWFDYMLAWIIIAVVVLGIAVGVYSWLMALVL